MTDRLQPLHDRRQFLATVSSSMAAAAFAPAIAATAAETEDTDHSTKICIFTKPFNSLSFDELADRIAELGFDGIEAPIRAGGHVEPEQVEDEQCQGGSRPEGNRKPGHEDQMPQIHRITGPAIDSGIDYPIRRNLDPRSTAAMMGPVVTTETVLQIAPWQ